MRITDSNQIDKELGRDPEQSPSTAPKASRELAMLPSRGLLGPLQVPEDAERLHSPSIV